MDAKVKSLAKALDVLDCFSVEQPELGVSDIARRTGMLKSTVSNILSTFEKAGYVVKNAENHRYRLGLRLVRFSYIITSHMGLNKIMLPYLSRIANSVHEIVYLGIPHGHDVLYIDSCPGDSRTNARNILGERAPMYCTGLGKTMLAFHEHPMSLLPPEMTAFTQNTLTTQEKLIAELDVIRERGYAVDNMEHEFGIKCVAMPVFGTDGKVCCAVSVSGPSLRFPEEELPGIVSIMRGILDEVQFKL